MGEFQRCVFSFRGVGAVATGLAMATPLLAEDRKITIVSKCQKRGEKKIEIAVLRGPSHVLYNHVHVLAFDMYVGIGCVYHYECDSASKEAYMYVSTGVGGYRDRR